MGGVAIAEFLSDLSGGGTSMSQILGGGPLALDPDPDPNTWKSFSFTTTTGPDVSGGVTLQLAAITGGASGSVSNMCFDNASVTVARFGAAWTKNAGHGSCIDVLSRFAQHCCCARGAVAGGTCWP